MSAASKDAVERNPLWSWFATGGAGVLLALKFLHLLPADNGFVVALAVVLLGAVVFASVHHAEVLALRVGEPHGSILLAIAVTVIEVGLIVSIMLSAQAGAETIGRDTVYSAVMVVLNGIVGLCLIVGGARHFEQNFRLEGASAALSVLATLAAIALILPNYTEAIAGPYYATSQLLFIGGVSLILYCVFVFVQTVRHRDYFMASSGDVAHHARPSARATAISGVLLPVSLLFVVLLAKTLSPAITGAVSEAGLPLAFVGVVIAMLVLLPEGAAAIRAARMNQIQTSLNLALGSAIASIGLTIPTLAICAYLLDMRLALGIEPEHTVLLVLTLFISSVTLATGRTTILQGAVHLVIFGVFMLISANP